MTEELDKLEAALEIKKDDIFFLFDPANHAIYDAARAHLTAQRQAPAKTPLEYFSKNIDGRKTIEVFESACFALKKADEATVAGDDVKHEIWFNIFKCESMRLMREYEEAPNIRAALTNSVLGKVVMKLREILQTAKQEFGGAELDLSNYGHGDICEINNCYVGILQLIAEALRELEPWVKEVE